VPDEIIEVVKEQQIKDQAQRGGRGGMHSRGDHRGDRGGRGTRGRGRGRGRGGGGNQNNNAWAGKGKNTTWNKTSSCEGAGEGSSVDNGARHSVQRARNCLAIRPENHRCTAKLLVVSW